MITARGGAYFQWPIACASMVMAPVRRLDVCGGGRSMYLDGSRQNIVTWVREGLSDRNIAERLRVSPSTVRYWRVRNGVVRLPRQKKTNGETGPGSQITSSPIEFVAGDLFANAHAVEAFAHGCNCKGSMGAGIAVGFRERYPTMYEQYRARCKAQPREFNLGDVWLWKALRKPWVFNLGTQEGVWRSRASYEAIEIALGRMRELADKEGIKSIAIPRIGVGYGGLSWQKVRAIVEQVLPTGMGVSWFTRSLCRPRAGKRPNI